jgi:hypothetical protein
MINIILSKGNYKNIAIKIEGFTPESIADSYLLKPYLKNNLLTLEKYISNNMTTFLDFIKAMPIGEKTHFPYDFSDQNVAFISIKKLNQKKLNIFFTYSTKLTFSDISKDFDPDLKIEDDKDSLIIGGKIIDIDNLNFSIINH